MGICSLAASAQKYVGGDISLLPKYEQAGAQYLDKDGKKIETPNQDGIYIQNHKKIAVKK